MLFIISFIFCYGRERCANALFGTSSKEELCTVRAIFMNPECLWFAGAVWSGKQAMRKESIGAGVQPVRVGLSSSTAL